MKIALITLVALLVSLSTFAQTTSYFSTNGTAIKGYDAVAYFLEKKAVAGKVDFLYEWSGSRWWFSSQANLDLFKANPEAYAPQYGGFCAYGLSEKKMSPSDPNAWTIVDNKLYLNYDPATKELWSKELSQRIKNADKVWPKIIK